MKKKLILFISLVAVLYSCLRFMFGIFTPYNYFTAKNDIKNNKFQLIEVGEIPLNFDLKQDLAKKNGFDFNLAGCLITPDIKNGIEYFNNTMIEHLKSKNGEDWWREFQIKMNKIDN